MTFVLKINMAFNIMSVAYASNCNSENHLTYLMRSELYLIPSICTLAIAEIAILPTLECTLNKSLCKVYQTADLHNTSYPSMKVWGSTWMYNNKPSRCLNFTLITYVMLHNHYFAQSWFYLFATVSSRLY